MMEKTWRWFGKKDKITLPMLRQIGVEGIVTALHEVPNGEIWTVEAINDLKSYIESYGLRWSVVESLPEPTKQYDFFISHASEDKDDIVRDLAEALRNNGFEVWYDEFELKIGDSLRKKIDYGLSNANYGIVIISPSFVKKNWTEYELNGMVAREMNGHKVILPIWHKITKDEVLRFSPSLADKLALNTSIHTIDDIVENLKNL